jgi:hypothetical protein
MPESDLGIAVVIPCFAEPDLCKSLYSIAQCTMPSCKVEVIVVVNCSENVTEKEKDLSNQNILDVKRASKEVGGEKLSFHVIRKLDLPHKYSGVGVARKYGMDEATYRFMKINNPRGIIDCFDADALCDSNYFVELYSLFSNNKSLDGCSIYYEHPLEGKDFSEDIYRGIARYELHLRYYNQACRYAELPYAYHTIGSNMACTAESYAKVGGMVKNKAGEDFYFLQKIILNGNFGELNSTRGIPSPRVSYRVPFGTGKAILKMQEQNDYSFLTYELEAFDVVKRAVSTARLLYRTSEKETKMAYKGLDEKFKYLIPEEEFCTAISGANSNATSQKIYERRFFTWFSAFRLMRYLNDAHGQNIFSRQRVESEVMKLLKRKGIAAGDLDARELLLIFRKIERNASNFKS